MPLCPRGLPPFCGLVLSEARSRSSCSVRMRYALGEPDGGGRKFRSAEAMEGPDTFMRTLGLTNRSSSGSAAIPCEEGADADGSEILARKAGCDLLSRSVGDPIAPGTAAARAARCSSTSWPT